MKIEVTDESSKLINHRLTHFCSIRIVCWGCNLDWKFVDFWYENVQGKMKCNECKNSVYYFKLWTPNEKKNKHIDTQYTEYLTFIVFSFQDKVNAAKVSGNLDAPEGGFDAIMQAIACEVCQISRFIVAWSWNFFLLL